MLSAGKNPVLTTLSEIKDFILSAIRGSASGEVRAFGIVGERLANAIASVNPRIDVYGNYIELNADDLRESYKRHANPKETGDIPLSETDFVNIPDHLNHFDYVLGTNVYNGKVEIHLAKKIADGYVHIITVSSKERGSLQVTKLIGVSADKFESKYGKKIERTAGSPRGQTANAEDSNPSTTARLTAGDPSINTIPQVGDGVNTYDMQKSAENSVPVDGDLGIIGVRASALDRAFMDMSEEERSSLIAAFEKNTGTRVVFDETIGADGKYENGVIYVNPNTATPMTVIKHELTHYLEKSGSYNDFMNFVFGSQAFAEWLRSKGQTQSEMRKEIIDRYAAAGKPLGQHGVDAGFEANQEILANFVGEKLFRDVNALAELAQKNRKWYQVLWDFVKGLFTKYQGTPIERELRQMERMFEKALQQRKAMKPNAGKGTAKFSFGVTQSDIDDYVDKAAMKENTEDIKKYAEPSEKLINEVANEIDLNGYTHALRDNDIRHIYNSHGVNTNEKYPVTDEDIKRIPDIVENYDKVFVKTNARGKPGIVYVKVGPDNVVYYVEAVTTEYHNEKLLVNKQMVKTGIGEIPNLHGLIDAINKKESSSQYLADLQEIRKAYVQDVKGNYSIDDIEPQNGADVNTQYTQDGAKYSVPPVLEAEETVERQGVVPEYTAQTGMEQFTDEQLREELRRRNPKANPLDIARLTAEDADTTPELGKSTVRNRKGDGESAFAGSLQGADIFDDRLKELAATDNKISRYDRIANKETMDAANKALNEGGAAYARAWEHKNSNTFTAEDVAVGSKKRAGTIRYRRVFPFGLI